MSTHWPFGRVSAASVVAAVAWPWENPDNRDEWAPKMLTDAQLRSDTIAKARGYFDAAIRALDEETK